MSHDKKDDLSHLYMELGC